MNKIERRLRWLDDRTMALHMFEEAVRLGRIQGEVRQMQRESHYRGFSAEPPEKYERTPQSRLQKHYEREFKRLERSLHE